MCGIVGYVGDRDAAPLVLDGLKRLEYRGYDSAGIAVVEDGRIERRRSAGKVSALESLLVKAPLKGRIALGHTRWATHGSPTEENAHPHADCTKTLVVIHNGIIENYLELRAALRKRGHRFESETDTEAVAHLIEEKLKAGPAASGGAAADESLLKAVRLTAAELKGSYALAVLWTGAPRSIVCAKTASPLILGLGKKENFLASDVPAFWEHTREALFLDDGEIALLKPGEWRLMDFKGRKKKKSPVTVSWDRATAEKGGFRHFMFKEIHEQPDAVEDTLRGRLEPGGARGAKSFKADTGLDRSLFKEIDSIHLVGCGTAFHACLMGRYWLEEFASLPANAETASEFRYRKMPFKRGDLAVVVSQSGETADALGACRRARAEGARVLAISNTPGSSLIREADFSFLTRCGIELGVASTKAFLGQLAALVVLAINAGIERKSLSSKEVDALVGSLLRLPALIRKSLDSDAIIQDVAKRYHRRNDFLYIGRGIHYPLALEGALKLKEISYIHAEGYAAGELKHGPIALVDEEMPIVAIATRSSLREKVLGAIAEVRARGASVIAVSTQGDPPVPGADCAVSVPATPEALSPFTAAVPLQLLAYHTARLRGCDVDQPRNLAKSVTVE